MVNFVKKLVINMKLSIEFEVTIVTLCDIKRKVADAITKLIHFDFLYDGIFFFFLHPFVLFQTGMIKALENLKFSQGDLDFNFKNNCNFKD